MKPKLSAWQNTTKGKWVNVMINLGEMTLYEPALVN